MRLQHALTPFTALVIGLVLAPAAFGASYGIVMPGDLDPANPLVTEATTLGGKGAKTAKFFVTWDVIEPVDGRFDTKKMDQYAATIRALNGAGIAATVVFFGASAWEQPDPAVRSRTPPASNQRFADAMGAFAAHLAANGAGGASFTVWNEADEKVFWEGAPEPDRYVDMLKRSHAAIKAADSTARVIFTPLTSGNWRFLQAAYERGAKGHFDAIGVDTDTACNLVSPYLYYRDQQDPDRVGQITFLGYREVRKTMLANGDDKPILLEFGWSTSAALCNQGLEAGKKPGGVSEAQQAQYLREAAHCLALDPYVETAYWFEIQDRGRVDTPDTRFGLLRLDGTRRPSYDAFIDVAGGVDTMAGQECGDFRPPQLTVVSPTAGQQYTDRIDIQAKASDANGIGRITLQFDGANEIRNFTGGDVGNDRVVGLTPWFKSDDLALGKHTVRVVAIDSVGNTTTQDVPIEKVTPDKIVSSFRAVFKVAKKVACKGRLCTLRVSLGKAAGGPSVNGKILAQWQWYSPPKPKKEGVRKKAIPGKWKTLHKARKPANKVFTLKQRLARRGRWRLRLTHEARPPYKAFTLKDFNFRVR